MVYIKYSSRHPVYINVNNTTLKSKRMRWTVYVARRDTGEVHTGFPSGDLSERNHFEDLRADGRIILK